MISFPNAKINIGLNIVSKRADGFHNLSSCFYPVPCSDVLELIPAQVTHFVSSGLEIPGQADQNLCLKAYDLLAKDHIIKPYKIHLHKTVPIGAGMGGGSADAAFTLKMLNELNQLQLSTDGLINYARQLGSDCAFFIENTPKYCFNKGDEFEPISLSLKGYHLVLVNPNIHISTAMAYAGVVPQSPKYDLRQLIQQPISNWKNTVINDFEVSLFPKYPMIKAIKDNLYDLGAVYAAMTGSGSTVFGIFENEPNINIFNQYWVYSSKLLI